MKKLVWVLAVPVMLLSFFSSCGKDDDSGGGTNPSVEEAYLTHESGNFTSYDGSIIRCYLQGSSGLCDSDTDGYTFVIKAYLKDETGDSETLTIELGGDVVMGTTTYDVAASFAFGCAGKAKINFGGYYSIFDGTLTVTYDGNVVNASFTDVTFDHHLTGLNSLASGQIICED